MTGGWAGRNLGSWNKGVGDVVAVEWGGVDEEVVAGFERDGFCVLPRVLPEDLVGELVAVGDRWIASDRQAMRQPMRAGSSDGFRNCVALDPAFGELLAWPAVLPYLVRLLGPDVHLLTSHLIHRGRAPAGTPEANRAPGWHRDFAKAQRSLGHARIPRLDIKCAYCLTDLPGPGYGGTLFARGSHLLREALPIPAGGDPAGAVEPTARAGDCILFENRTWHAGGTNVRGPVRKVVMMGYTYVWIRPSDYALQDDATLARAAQRYGDVGLQLLGGLPPPTQFDYDYDSRPLRAAFPEAERTVDDAYREA